jgi:hypothetical protein
MFSYKKSLFFFTLIVSFLAMHTISKYAIKAPIDADKSEASFDKQGWVTIYVHGTTTKLGLQFLSKFLPEVGYGAPGLHHVDEMEKKALFRRDVDILCAGDSKRFNKDHFYTFRWSGTLSFSARQIAGKELYEAVIKLLEEYKKKYGYYPKIRIMTFSHGGNVALNMASHLPFFKGEHVHLELLIVACPVQKVTEKFIQHREIDSVYTIYSTRDLLQIVDTYTFEKKRYFPKRFFKNTCDNCRQIKVLINKRGLGHLDLLRSFMLHLPDALNKADSFALGQNDCCVKGVKCGKEAGIIEVSIEDDKFCFYKGYNLIPCVYGKRKKQQ